jgi:hypothetical protein
MACSVFIPEQCFTPPYVCEKVGINQKYIYKKKGFSTHTNGKKNSQRALI